MTIQGDLTQLKYMGSTPGADANTYVLFSTVAAGFPQRFFALTNTHKVLIDIAYSNGGGGTAMNWYVSSDRGLTWRQEGTQAMAAPTTTYQKDFVVESAPDWKLEWVNGGAAQTVWEINIALVDHRCASV